MLHLLLLVTAVPVVAAAVAPACDTSKKSKDVCDDFCNNRCGFYNTSLGDTGAPTNMTVYRIEPKNVSGLVNINSGDAPGDVTFVLQRKNLTQYCLHNPSSLGCHTHLQNEDLYGAFVVEVDGQWGPYQECNPADGWDTGDWKCGLDCLRPSHKGGCPRTPTSPYSKNGTSFSGGFNCWCDRTYKTAGRERPPSSASYRHYFPDDWTPQCVSGSYRAGAMGFCVTGSTYKTLPGWSVASLLTMACKECDKDAQCSGWALNDDGKTVDLFHGDTSGISCSAPEHSASKQNTSKYHTGTWDGVGNLGGYWYSFTKDGGECKKGMPIGTDGCTFRVVETLHYKNSSCVDSYVDAAVETHGKKCFDMCPQPLKRLADCYLDCYRNVLLGDASLNLTKPATKQIVDPWVNAIQENDPSKGGCPPVKPTKGPFGSGSGNIVV